MLTELSTLLIDIKNLDLNAQIVAMNIAKQIENRASFRMAQKTAIRNTLKAGAKGIKTLVSGRLAGADIARSEGYTEGTKDALSPVESERPKHCICADACFSFRTKEHLKRSFPN